jgi:hypothetical protein
MLIESRPHWITAIIAAKKEVDKILNDSLYGLPLPIKCMVGLWSYLFVV